MRRTLSSEWTGFYKFFLAFWISFFGLGTLCLFLGIFRGKGYALPPDSMKWLFLCLWMGGSLFSYFTCASLKEVSADEHSLYISNYINEISIPLDDIDNVTENTWLNIHPVTIHLKHPSRFGSEITFMPKIKFSAFGEEHPVVHELRRAAKIDGGKSMTWNAI